MALNGRIWVTRAEPGASATAGRLRALGLEPLVSPVLEVRPLEAAIDTDKAAALAFTSANAVRAFAAREPGRALPVFAVGEATAQAALEAGFAAVESADGDVAALARLIAARKPGLVLNPTAAEPAQDLAALLAPAGVAVRTAALYESVPAEPASALAELDAITTVLVHSPKAARRLAARLDPSALARLDFACISEAAARPLLEAGAPARVAASSTEAALLELVGAPKPPEPEDERPFRVLDVRFWLALAFLVLCLIAAAVVGWFGPKIWPKAPPPPAPAAAPR
jgi:uroporphyrinogen-III synthase